MKEFVIYTALRLLLFVGAMIVVVGIWSLFSDTVNGLIAIILAFLLSGVASFYLLGRPREAFARRVEARADRAASRLNSLRDQGAEREGDVEHDRDERA